MEERKQKEIEFYDKQADKGSGDFEGFNPYALSSYKFLYSLLEGKCSGKKILDYGCGTGIHSVFLAKSGGEVVAIDLSENQLEIAKKRAKKEGVADRIKFIKMDCEKLDFSNEFFDIIFDGGTFSSLELSKALPELARVLTKDGFLAGIETFGHNPAANLKRKINKITGKRTGWAATHIFQTKDLQEVKNYFGEIKVDYFHLLSLAAFPLLRLPGGKYFLKSFELADAVLFKAPFLQRYAFKVVFIFSKPKR